MEIIFEDIPTIMLPVTINGKDERGIAEKKRWRNKVASQTNYKEP